MPDPSPFRILAADRLLDGTGAPPLHDAAVLLEGSAIRAIGRRAEVRAPDGATAPVTDYGDATILPGLVDGHTHLVAPGDATRGDVIGGEEESFLLLRAAANAAAALRSGVTTLRENGAKGRVAFDLRDAIVRGVLPGPRMLVCGRPVTITGGHLHFFGGETDGPDGARATVRGLIKEGADFIKIVASGGSTRSSHIWMPAFTPAELAAIVDEAHRGERLTGAHAVPNAAIADVLDAGIDMVIHCSMFEADGTYRYRPDLAERIVASGTWVNPTMHDIRAWIHWERDLVASGGSLTPEERTGFEQTLRFWEAKLDTVSRMRALGAKMMAGSDSPWGRSLPGRGWRELEAFTEAGYSNAEAIVIGTSAAAEAIGAGDVAGTLAPGRPADILIVPGDPLADLTVLGTPRDVWQAGARVPQVA